MIELLDEALRQILIDELNIRSGEIDIQYRQPNKDWSSRLSRPTINIFLYDIRENVKLRQHSPQYMEMGRVGSLVSQQLRPMQINVYYLITAWANEPEDEHRMLGRILMALYRHPYLTDQYRIGDLRDQPGRIEILAAQPELLNDATLFWSAMDNQMRAGIVCQVAMALDPHTPFDTPIVTDRGLGFSDERGIQDAGVAEFWVVRGQLNGPTPLRRVRAILVEEDMTINVRYDGAFTIQGLPAGDYTLEVSLEGQSPTRHAFTVPSPEYVFDV
jgi:hypothetical protein